ncbi:MAG: hypothetical protein A3D31_18120 [Candidatus Fluviicola riflensis]|nr:MAG: hypothetical protein CHH17_03060 [Candidatus Fluviicola riflensis]OGS76898.1 MAG: hypothetical protein A3D31_18120 [Candidatus Fluviicola riflensis]OGS81827.1 MAG: hypothetical protein A2724_15520 [Fluviicola sp. RIFCSPHIGHO2_01_FULL_43_53]OGS88627.1 MAG: hypothetical protein A3E30_07630 [Fluviicola sp. RIFCSPHIGHO2_12_FULL_43_24]
MKKILLALVVMLATFAASAQKSAALSAKALESGKSTGTYVFVMPSDLTTAQVDEVKGYYKQYFTVNYNQVKHEATLVLLEDKEMNKRVILRFLSAVGTRTVNVDGTEKTLEEFFDNDLK